MTKIIVIGAGVSGIAAGKKALYEKKGDKIII